MLKDIKQQFEKEYKYRIELHTHTNPGSSCSEIPPEELIETYTQKGYDAVVITNHFVSYMFEGLTKEDALDKYLSDFEKAKSVAENSNIRVLLGAEIRFDENCNDYLIFGVDREVLSKGYDYFGKGLRAFRTEVSLDKSVFVQAHPHRDGMEETDPSLLDGYEIFNMHPGHNSRVAISTRHAKNAGAKIVTVGSDYHHRGRGHEGISALRTKVLPNDSFALAEILKSGDYVFEIGERAIILP